MNAISMPLARNVRGCDIRPDEAAEVALNAPVTGVAHAAHELMRLAGGSQLLLAVLGSIARDGGRAVVLGRVTPATAPCDDRRRSRNDALGVRILCFYCFIIFYTEVGLTSTRGGVASSHRHKGRWGVRLGLL